MVRLRDKLTATSCIRYLLWRTGLFGTSVTVRLAGGGLIVLNNSHFLETAVAHEIFVSEIYRSPRPLRPGSVRRIVDIGANVGYTLVWWMTHYPEARIEAFEPHPGHLSVLKKCIRLNGLVDRVVVHPAAVGTKNDRLYLLDAGVCSAIVAQNGVGRIPVDVVDFFQAVEDGPIDLLKVDCEGGEYAVLMDSRFGELQVKTLVMEWHATVDHPKADKEILARLKALDWEVELGAQEDMSFPHSGLLRVGMLWAYR